MQHRARDNGRVCTEKLQGHQRTGAVREDICRGADMLDNGLQVGGLGGAPNRKVVFQNITLDDPDVETLEYLKGKGADIIFQTIPEDTPMKLDDILKRYK